MLTTILTLLPLSVAPAVSDEAAFVRALEQVEKRIDQGRYAAAKEDLLELLAEHEGAAFVVDRLARIRAYLSECTFRTNVAAPELESLISGELRSHSASSGKVELAYGADRLTDFDGHDEENPLAGPLIHPMTFEGPFTVEIDVSAYPKGSFPMVLVGVGTDSMYSVVFGLGRNKRGGPTVYLPARISKWVDGAWRTLVEEDDPEVEGGAACTLAVKVKSSSITAYCDGRKILAAKRAKGAYGSVGFHNLPGPLEVLDEIRLTGKAQPSWFQGLVDEALQVARQRFDGAYDPSEDLPAWLVDGSSAPPELDPLAELPGERRPDDRDLVKTAADFVARGRLEDGLAWAWELGDRTSVELALHLRTTFLIELERYEEARRLLDELARLAPDHPPTLARRAVVVGELEGSERRLAELQALRQRFADSPAVVSELVQYTLLEGRLDEATTVLRGALRAGLHDPRLRALDAQLNRARAGPRFQPAYEYKTRHYHVTTDIDEETAYRVAQELEDAYSRYRRDLGYVEVKEQPRFRVFVFSGEAGFQAYFDALGGGAIENVAGLYTPVLKQLLIWNLPDREQMLTTVRHEGFHQYLDSRMDDPPRWLNEGLAEYYETSELERGRWKDGAVHPSHAWILTQSELPVLSEFLSMSSAEFNRDMGRHYALAWAFVHFLRHESADARKLFEGLFDDLLDGRSSQVAVGRLLESVDPVDLERRFARHLAELAGR